MDNKLLDYNMFSRSMLDGCSEMSKPSGSQKKVKKLTLFDDLPHDSGTQNLHSDTNLEDQYHNDSSPSDCESGISGADYGEKLRPYHNGVVRIHEAEKILETIKKKFVTSLGSYGYTAEFETIKRNDYSCIMSRVKYRSFCLYSRGMEIKRDGNANVKYAWYGGSKDELNSIVSHGFSLPPCDPRLYGRGVYLSPVDYPVESLQSSTADENGVRHMLLCRVILGNTEVIRPGSEQYNPSSEEFDSGVDDLASPKKYIVWIGNMNARILPEFVVSFRASSYCRGCQKIWQPHCRLPSSDWMPFSSLVNDLSKFLPLDAIKLISKLHCDYKKHKMTRQEMIHRLRQIAGDKLLIAIIKSHRQNQKMKASWSSNSSRLNTS